MTAALELSWSARYSPLEPVAVLAVGHVAQQLEASLQVHLEQGAFLRAAGGLGWLLVLGTSAALPWADGAHYLGWDSGILCPTTQQPYPPMSFLCAYLPAAELVAVLDGHIVITDMPQNPVDPAKLSIAASDGS